MLDVLVMKNKNEFGRYWFYKYCRLKALNWNIQTCNSINFQSINQFSIKLIEIVDWTNGKKQNWLKIDWRFKNEKNVEKWWNIVTAWAKIYVLSHFLRVFSLLATPFHLSSPWDTISLLLRLVSLMIKNKLIFDFNHEKM